MTIIVFLIDTSASMNARCYLGGRPTLLDVAKGAVETFVKVRQRSPESRGDRYMLLSFEDPPQNIKAGWKENLATFMNELKNLRSDGLTTMGPALKNAFDLLNINRMQSGIDTYGQGRCPFFLEPSVIVVITDGGKLTSLSGIQEDFNLPMHSPIPGSELTREPFRWDQRLFSLVLRLPGTPALEQNIGLVPSDTSPIDAMCEVTGGRSYCVTSHRIMIQCIDSLVQKVQSGVVINFEKIGPEPLPPEVKSEPDSQPEEFNEWLPLSSPTCSQDGNGSRTNSQNNSQSSQTSSISASLAASPSAWHNCRRLIYVARSAQKGFAVGYWPIPENFWPDLNSASLPPRSAHPNVKFTCTSQEPMVIENLPFDKYELEPSPLTQYILARKQPTVCWQVFVANSYKNSEVGHPFGYLKASTNLTCVNLFVMPYNYPVLLPLLDELFKIHRLKPTNEWRTQFQNYLRTMPPYYAGPLKRALIRMNTPGSLAQTLIPDALESSLSYSVLNYLKRLKNQAKSEFDRMCNEVGSKATSKTGPNQEGARVLPRSPLRKELVSHPLLQDKFISLREQLNEFGGFVVGIPQTSRAQQVYLNPGDIPRNQLVDQYNLLRDRFFNPKSRLDVDDDNEHNLPVNQMGNYQEYLKRMPMPLREIESTPVRQHMFGNPFKIDKRMMVDEADIDLVAGGSSPARGTKRAAPTEPSPRQNNKRKPGPLPKDTIARRPSGSGMFSIINSPVLKHGKKSHGRNNLKGPALPKHFMSEGMHSDFLPMKNLDSLPPKLTSINEQDNEIGFSGDEGVNLKMPIIDEEDEFNYESYQSQVQRGISDESRENKVDLILVRVEDDSDDNGFFKPSGPSLHGPMQNGYLASVSMEVYDPKMEIYNPKLDVNSQISNNILEVNNNPKKDVKIPKKGVNNSKKEANSQKKEANNQKKETNNPKKEASNPKKDSNNPKKDSNNPKKEANNPKKEANSQKKEANHSKKEANNPKKEANNPKKEANNPKKEANNPKKEANNPKKEGNNPKKEGNNPKKEPNNPKKEGNNPKKEGNNSKKDVNPKKDGNSQKNEDKKEENNPKKEDQDEDMEVDLPEPSNVRVQSCCSAGPAAHNDEERVLVEINGNAAEPESAENAIEIDRFNAKIRSSASLEVRKPGRRHGPLLEQLKNLKGNLDTRLLVVEDIISEALRFKRFFLAGVLQDFASANEFLFDSATASGVDR